LFRRFCSLYHLLSEFCGIERSYFMVHQEARKSWIATQHWERLTDGLAIALAASLPWSTSLTGILAGLWLTALIPTLSISGLRRVIATPAGGLPVVFLVLALIGMLWAFDVPMAERWDGLKSLFKLLVIPLLMFQFQHSSRAPWVMNGFLMSCGALLILSWVLILVPTVPVPGAQHGGFGVPVKDYIAQTGEFAVCIFLLAGIALKAWQEQQRWLAVALASCALLFLSNLFFSTTSRTGLVVIPVLLLLFIFRHGNRRRTAGLLLTTAALGIGIWSFAPKITSSVSDIVSEVRSFQPEGESTRAGERLEFWRKSIGFVADAPLLGHGTGSIRDQFRRAAAGQSGMAALASSNPHNQTLAVAIQLGLVGTAVLFAMWLAHAVLFRAGGLVSWAGLVVVTQNVVSSLFNSHLFDFTQGWGYVIGVGVAAGAMLKSATAHANRRAECGG
jgi:O-antigen ligase